jgi:hypothetical protein
MLLAPNGLTHADAGNSGKQGDQIHGAGFLVPAGTTLTQGTVSFGGGTGTGTILQAGDSGTHTLMPRGIGTVGLVGSGTGTGTTLQVGENGTYTSMRYGFGTVGPLGLHPVPDYIAPPTQSLPPSKGLVDAFVKTCQRWHLPPAQQVVLLGYTGSEFLGQQLLEGRVLALSQDAQDRTGYILGISVGLGALFDESEEAELTWLAAPREALSGQSALSFMLEGRMANLMVVAAMVAHERGL